MTYNEFWPYSGSLDNDAGVITLLANNDDCPWRDIPLEDLLAVELTFRIMHGNKEMTYSAPRVEGISDLLIFALALKGMFVQKWTKLWNIYSAEYNILDAYIVNETGTNTKNNTRNKDFTHGHKINESGTSTGSIDTETTANETVNDSVYAFNSSSPSPNASSTTNDKTNNVESRDLENSRETTHSGVDKEENTDTESGNYTIKKTGNIGYVTPQSMLREEMVLWAEPFFRQVFNDIVNFCMYQVY